MPFCANCGRDLSPAAVSCPNCGHPGPAAGTVAVAAPGKRTEGLAIASLVCGIVGFFGVPIVGSILAIVFGAAARKRIAADPTLGGADLARAGTIMGRVGLVLVLVLMIIGILVILLGPGLSHWKF